MRLAPKDGLFDNRIVGVCDVRGCTRPAETGRVRILGRLDRDSRVVLLGYCLEHAAEINRRFA